MSDTPVSDVRTLIESLGDGTVVADELNKLLPATERRVDREAVYKWKEANSVPHYRRLYMAILAASKKQPLPPELAIFAVKSPDHRPTP